MNYLYKQEYEAAAQELQLATLGVGNYTVQIMGISESAFVRYQAALQGFTFAKRKYFEETDFSTFELFSAALMPSMNRVS